MTTEQKQALFAPFKTEEIQWRLNSTTERDGKTIGCAVPYIDSRAIQRRLDNVLGEENWQNSFTAVSTGNPKDPVANICSISIYSAEHNEWITKSDGAGGTDYEPIKGGFSDAFKRAASMFGIGRYMYELDMVWVDVEAKNKSKSISKTSIPKLKAEYEKAVSRIFGTNLAKQIASPPSVKNTGGTAVPPAPTSSGSEPSAAQKQAVSQNIIPFCTVNQTRKNGDNTALQISLPNNQYELAFVKGTPELLQGQQLKNVKWTQKESPKIGRHYLISDYEVVENTA